MSGEEWCFRSASLARPTMTVVLFVLKHFVWNICVVLKTCVLTSSGMVPVMLYFRVRDGGRVGLGLVMLVA